MVKLTGTVRSVSIGISMISVNGAQVNFKNIHQIFDPLFDEQEVSEHEMFGEQHQLQSSESDSGVSFLEWSSSFLNLDSMFRIHHKKKKMCNSKGCIIGTGEGCEKGCDSGKEEQKHQDDLHHAKKLAQTMNVALNDIVDRGDTTVMENLLDPKSDKESDKLKQNGGTGCSIGGQDNEGKLKLALKSDQTSVADASNMQRAQTMKRSDNTIVRNIEAQRTNLIKHAATLGGKDAGKYKKYGTKLANQLAKSWGKANAEEQGGVVSGSDPIYVTQKDLQSFEPYLGFVLYAFLVLFICSWNARIFGDGARVCRLYVGGPGMPVLHCLFSSGFLTLIALSALFYKYLYREPCRGIKRIKGMTKCCVDSFMDTCPGVLTGCDMMCTELDEQVDTISNRVNAMIGTTESVMSTILVSMLLVPLICVGIILFFGTGGSILWVAIGVGVSSAAYGGTAAARGEGAGGLASEIGSAFVSAGHAVAAAV